jgi:hypothetical protein
MITVTELKESAAQFRLEHEASVAWFTRCFVQEPPAAYRPGGFNKRLNITGRCSTRKAPKFPKPPIFGRAGFSRQFLPIGLGLPAKMGLLPGNLNPFGSIAKGPMRLTDRLPLGLKPHE